MSTKSTLGFPSQISTLLVDPIAFFRSLLTPARYPQLFGLAEQRSTVVSNGMANAKANEAAIAAAKAAPEAVKSA